MSSTIAHSTNVDQLLLLADDLPVMVWVTRPDATCVFLNQRWYDYTGQRQDEALGLGWLAAVHPDDAQPSGEIFLAANGARQPFALDYRLRAADGTYRWMKDTGRPRFDDQGAFLGFVGSVTDIHELKMTQERLQMAITSTDLGTWDLDPTTGELIWSDSCKALFGLPPQTSITYELFLQGLHPDDRERTDLVVQAALQGQNKGFYAIEYRTVGLTDGHLRWIRAQGQAHFDQQGAASRFVGTVVDITQHKLTHELLEQRVAQQTHQLRVANADLKRSNDNLQQFAYVASHDLQEPLRKIRTFGDLLKAQYGQLIGPGLVYLERMQAASTRMATLIRDLLTYSRLSHKPIDWVAVSLDSVLDTVLGDLDLLVADLGAQVRVEECLPTVAGDEGQLEQLFLNLVSNALKFRKPGPGLPLVNIRSQFVPVSDLPPALELNPSVEGYHRIDVIDNGIGFEEKYLDRIFEVFQRLHSRQTYAGTGIGLAICQQVAKAHGGVITATSQPGHGASFHVYLPT